MTNKKVENLEKTANMYTQKLKMLSYRSLDIECRSKRNNIVFWGITERLPYNDCKQLIYSFMRDQLFSGDRDFDPSREMCIERAHRLGSLRSESYRGKSDPKRPIIVRFRDYNDTELVMERAYRLRGSVFSLDRDYPKEIAQARKELYSSKEAKEGRRKQQRVQIKYPARLYVDGRFIADKFPEWFKILGQSRVDGFELPSTTTDEHSVMSEMQMSFSNGGLGHDRHGQSRDSSEQRTERSMIRKPAWLSARRDDWNERRTPQGSPVRANNDKTLTEATQQSPSLLDSVSQNVNNENHREPARICLLYTKMTKKKKKKQCRQYFSIIY